MHSSTHLPFCSLTEVAILPSHFSSSRYVMIPCITVEVAVAALGPAPTLPGHFPSSSAGTLCLVALSTPFPLLGTCLLNMVLFAHSAFPTASMLQISKASGAQVCQVPSCLSFSYSYRWGPRSPHHSWTPFRYIVWKRPGASKDARVFTKIAR